MTASLYVTARIRKSPFFEATLRAGATAFSVYNKTYLPGGYADPETEFWSLVNQVALWDVTCQRVVEIAGPDAQAFADYLTPRDLSRMRPGLCRYVLLTDSGGGIVNDPVLMQLAPDRFWCSSADSDLAMWLRGVLVGSTFEVTVSLPEVATLQLQGPNSVALLRELLGDRIDALAYYHHMECELDGIPLLVARTGWSAERGYELYLRDLDRGERLWERLMSAGAPYGIAPASPSRIRRIEAGTPDYGVDMDAATNPYELGLQRLVQLDAGDFIGREALREIAARGPARRLVGLGVSGAPVAPNDVPFACTAQRDRGVGRMSSWVYSPRLERNIGLAMVEEQASASGTRLVVEADGEPRAATVESIPFVDPDKRLARA